MADDNKENRDPWGKKTPDEGPPDLMELLKKAFNKGRSPGNGSGSAQGPSGDGLPTKFLLLGGIALLVIWFLSGIFIVSPAEEAVVLRFGRYVGTEGPGPHWIPPLIQSRRILNVQEVSTFPYNSEMLTKDENIVSVAVAVQYRIQNPKDYLFNTVDPDETLRMATSSALRQAVGQMSLDAILTIGRQQLRDDVAKQLDIIMDMYGTGLVITDVTLQPAKPPEPVTAAFDDAIKAREDEQRFINKAQAYARQKLSLAQGTIATIQQRSQAYKQEVVLRARGDTARYSALLRPYQAAPEITRDRLYLDALSSVLEKTSNVIVDGSKGNLLYLPLDQLRRQTVGSTPTDKSGVDISSVTAASVPDPAEIDSGSVYSGASRPSYPSGGESR